MIIFTVDEAAEYLKVGRTTIFALLRDNKFPVIKISRSTRIRQSDLDDFINSCAKPFESGDNYK